MRPPKRIAVIPSASRLVRSLRDLGYEFPQAVADLVDNSIAAEAGRISIELRFEGPDSWLRIIDDGMWLASQGGYAPDLSAKWGLTLKATIIAQNAIGVQVHIEDDTTLFLYLAERNPPNQKHLLR